MYLPLMLNWLVTVDVRKFSLTSIFEFKEPKAALLFTVRFAKALVPVKFPEIV